MEKSRGVGGVRTGVQLQVQQSKGFAGQWYCCWGAGEMRYGLDAVMLMGCLTKERSGCVDAGAVGKGIERSCCCGGAGVLPSLATIAARR